MYKVSQEVKNLFNKNYIQVADITVNGVNESFSVAENEIVQGSLSIDRYSVSNSKIEVGSAVAAELTLKLKNDDGKYDNTVFEGAEVFVKIGIKKWDAHRWENAVIHWIPCGYFTIDEPPRALSTITISALDRMILFDKTVDISKLSFPMTVADLLNKICTICGVTMATDITRLPNKDYQITAYPEGQDLTYRTLLQWCAALTGTCAFMNYDGNLELKWYEQTDLTISPSERYNSDMQENDVTITGIYFKDAANTEYIAGMNDYCLDLSSNGLLQDNVQVVLDTLYVSLKGFSYRPYTATVKAAPYIYPMDMIHYEDAKGEVHDTIITNVTFGMNLSTSIAGKGETTQKQKYSQSGGLTKQQATILEKLRERMTTTITAKEQAQLELNRLLSNSLGLNMIVEEQSDRTRVYYFCNGENLEGSTIIYTLKANGFAWTDDWNGGNPVWKYGFTKDGNAVLNTLATYKLTSEYIDVGAITAEKISTNYTTEMKTYADGSSAKALKDAKADTDNKLKSYSTTTQMNSAIQQSSTSIKSTVAQYQNKYDLSDVTVDVHGYGYPTTSNGFAAKDYEGKYYLNQVNGYLYYSNGSSWSYKKSLTLVTKELQSQIEQNAKGITAIVKDGELNSSISLSASAVKLAWNNISKYIQFESGELRIYDSAAESTQKLRSVFNESGEHFYRDGYYVGKIGTNKWSENNAHKGLVFDLNYQGKYMAFAQASSASATSYNTMLCFSRANSIYDEYGIHLGCALYTHGYEIHDPRISGAGVKYSGTWYNAYTGEIPVCTQISIQSTGNGGISWSYSTSKIRVASGLIVGYWS